MPSRSAFTLIEMLTVVAVLIIVLGLMVSLARDVRNKSANQLTIHLFRQLDDALRQYAENNAGELPEVTPLIADNAAVPDELTLHRIARRNNEDFVRALRKYFVHSKTTTRPGENSLNSPHAEDSLNSPHTENSLNSPHADSPLSSRHPAGLPGAPPGDGSSFSRSLPFASPANADTGIANSANANTEQFGDLPTSIYDEVTLRDAWGDPIVFMQHDHPAIGMASRAAPSFFFSAGPDHRYLTRDDNLYSYEANRGEPSP